MLKLVIKDFRANQGYLLLLFAILILIGMGYSMAIKAESDIEPEIYVLVIILSATVASKLFILTEVEAGADKLIAGLPVNRKQMVLARYLSSVLMIILTLIVHCTIIYLTSDEAMRHENQFMYRPEIWIVSGLLLMVSDAFSFPFHFAFGAIKGAVMYGFTLISFMILTILIISMTNSNVAWREFFLKISQQSVGLIFGELAFIFLLILGSSILISINAFKNKDL